LTEEPGSYHPPGQPRHRPTKPLPPPFDARCVLFPDNPAEVLPRVGREAVRQGPAPTTPTKRDAYQVIVAIEAIPADQGADFRLGQAGKKCRVG
jgi:hypothetical protein